MLRAPTYQVMPNMLPDEFEALKADIAERGIQVPIDLDEHGNILDGHHRDRAWRELQKNAPPPTRVIAGLNEEEKRAFARKNNILRRHLTRDQVRHLIEQQLKETPGWADRRAARELGVDHKTVGAVRDRLISTGEIPQLDKLLGADGKERSERPRKPATAKRGRRNDGDGWPPTDERVQELLTTHSVLSNIPGSEQIRERVILEACERMLESPPLYVLPYPEPRLLDPELRRWGAFANFLEREHGFTAEDAGSHIDWILRRDFKTPEEWLGEEGARFRRSLQMREPGPAVHKAWSDFAMQAAENV